MIKRVDRRVLICRDASQPEWHDVIDVGVVNGEVREGRTQVLPRVLLTRLRCGVFSTSSSLIHNLSNASMSSIKGGLSNIELAVLKTRFRDAPLPSQKLDHTRSLAVS